MRIAICDDDALCRQQVSSIIQEHVQDKDISVSIYDKSNELFEDAIRIEGYDIYILDIIMPDLDGIQLASKLRQSGLDGKILFLTSSNEFGIDAFKVQASNYIMKPIHSEELISALDLLITSIESKKEKSLIVKSKDSTVRLNFDTILYAELVRKSVVFHLVNGQQITSTSIRSSFTESMQELLRDSRFTLCGSSRLVNLHYMIELSGEELRFKNGTAIYIGRRAAREIRTVWYDFWFNKEDDNL